MEDQPEEVLEEMPVPEMEVEVVNEIKPIQTSNAFSLMASDIDVENIARNAEKYMDIEKRLRQIAIKVTNINDWIDEGGKPYLMWSGAARIARALGVSYTSLKYVEYLKHDDKGDFIIGECTGKILWKGAVIEEVGTGTSRKPLLCMRYDKEKKESYMLPLSEIDQSVVRKMAQTNFLNRGLKSMVGLNFTWEEVEDATGMKRNSASGKVTFNKTKNMDDPRRAEIKNMLLTMHGKEAKVILMAMTTFKGSDGKQVPGKQKLDDCTDKQIENMYQNLKNQYEEFVVRKAQDDTNTKPN